MISPKMKIKTEVLQSFELGKHLLSIEKIIEGKYFGHYIIRSYVKGLLGCKLCSLAAWDVESDDSNTRIEKYTFKPFRMLNQAIDYAKYIKHNKYQNWIKYQ